MPSLLVIKNLMFIIHTRDHGFPHVTIDEGAPERWESRAKARLDLVREIEVDGFSVKDMRVILSIVEKNKLAWLEAWYDYQK